MTWQAYFTWPYPGVRPGELDLLWGEDGYEYIISTMSSIAFEPSFLVLSSFQLVFFELQCAHTVSFNRPYGLLGLKPSTSSDRHIGWGAK
jgi:hypothetical protein